MRRKINYDMVKKEFEERGYVLLSSEYINNSTKLQYLCPNHCTFGGISEERAKENLESCKLRDRIKDNFCQTNGIKLLRIPYTQFNNIESIITSIVC